MPHPKGISRAKKRKLDSCERKLKGKPGINRYAVCRAGITQGKKRAIARRLGRS